jgi:hypothetical protein
MRSFFIGPYDQTKKTKTINKCNENPIAWKGRSGYASEGRQQKISSLVIGLKLIAIITVSTGRIALHNTTQEECLP